MPAVWVGDTHAARCDDAGLAGEVAGMALAVLAAVFEGHRSTDRLVPALGGAPLDQASGSGVCEMCGTSWPCDLVCRVEADPRVAGLLEWWASGLDG